MKPKLANEDEKLPPPAFVKTDKISCESLLTAKSGRPSPLKSPTATDWEPEPVAKFRGARNVPSPLPSNTLTVPGAGDRMKLPRPNGTRRSLLFTTTRSSRPSPLKSAVRIEDCPPPQKPNPIGLLVSVTVVTGAWKVPLPLPSSNVMSSDVAV